MDAASLVKIDNSFQHGGTVQQNRLNIYGRSESTNIKRNKEKEK